MHTQELIVQGNEAIVRGALQAGCTFFAGYPITPASEIAELMAAMLPDHDGVFIQMEDEIGSIMSLIGAAWGGKKACTATSGPGFSLMQEGIGYAAVTETPCVIIDVMRGGPATGQPTMPSQQDVMQARFGAHGDYEVIALAPASVQEGHDFTVKAFNLAERFRVPTMVLSDEIVSHTREKLRIASHYQVIERKTPEKPPGKYKIYEPLASGLLDGMPRFGQGYNVLVDGQLHDEEGNRAGSNPEISRKLLNRLISKVQDHEEEIRDVETYHIEDAETIIVAYGSVARPAHYVVNKSREKGKKVGLIKLNVIWPFPKIFMKNILNTVTKVIVPEMNCGKIFEVVECLCKNNQDAISVSKQGGELHTPEEIMQYL